MKTDTRLDTDIRDQITNLAKRYGLAKVILFGSRARGDGRPRSDIDLAVSGGDIVGFRTDIDEEVRTLLMFDVVDLDSPVQEELLASIRDEGDPGRTRLHRREDRLPKMIIKLAYSAGMIQDERGWLELLDKRNEIAHSYNEKVALSIIEKVKECYLGLFQDLAAEIAENWI